MAQSAFYRVTVKANGRDISSLISKLSFDECVDIDDMLTLHINTQDVNDMDDPDLKEGSILLFNFGYLAGKISKIHTVRVANHLPTYGTNINFVVQCTPLGILLKKNKTKKVWEKMRSSDIVRAIAAGNALQAVVDETIKIHEFIPQVGKTDYELLKHLTTLETNGSYRFFLKDDTIHFTKIKLSTPAVRTFTYKDGNGSVTKFTPYSREMLKDGASRNTVITSVDPFTNTPIQKIVNNQTAKDDVKLGDFVIHFNENAEQIAVTQGKQVSKVVTNQVDPQRAGEHIIAPVTDGDHAENIANSKKKKKAMHDYEATLEVEGDSDNRADEIITMAGVAKRDLGNWYVTRVNHSLDDSGGYHNRLTLNKNAAKAKTISDTTQQTTVNKSVGAPTSEVEKPKKVELLYFDEDSNQLDR